MTSIIPPIMQQIFTGMVIGCIDFVFCTTTQKTCMLAGVKFLEIEEEGDIPPSERFDKDFWNVVVKYPIIEEVIFRGLFQTVLSKGLLFCMPQLAQIGLFNISKVDLASSVIIGTGFGIGHYFNYKSGGKQAALIGSISGSLYGIMKARFGLLTSCCGHMVHNFMVTALDRHYPRFLDSSLDTLSKSSE